MNEILKHTSSAATTTENTTAMVVRSSNRGRSRAHTAETSRMLCVCVCVLLALARILLIFSRSSSADEAHRTGRAVGGNGVVGLVFFLFFFFVFLGSLFGTTSTTTTTMDRTQGTQGPALHYDSFMLGLDNSPGQDEPGGGLACSSFRLDAFSSAAIGSPRLAVATRTSRQPFVLALSLFLSLSVALCLCGLLEIPSAALRELTPFGLG